MDELLEIVALLEAAAHAVLPAAQYAAEWHEPEDVQRWCVAAHAPMQADCQRLHWADCWQR